MTAPKPGRGGYSDLQDAVWARDYVDAVREHPTRPIAALVESDPTTKAADWRRRLPTAEDKGLLADRPKGTEGRAGGRLTKRAERILADAGMPTTTTKETKS